MADDKQNTGAFIQAPSLANKIWHWLGFYARFDEALFDWRQDVPNTGDLITSNTTIMLSWGDRIRVLFSGKCSLTVWTKTANEVGITESRSQFCVLP